MAPNNSLNVTDISKSFGPTRALHQISAQFESGRIYTILGENGSGKSTLVKVLSGIRPPDTGEIIMNGTAVNASSPRDMIQLGITIVLQEVLISPNRSVLENIFLGQDTMFGRPKENRCKLAKKILASLSDRPIDLNRPAGELALHERQILVIARGLARNPNVLILDEVTASLDLADRAKLFETLKAYRAAGGIVIFVSHRMQEILELSDHVLILRNGEFVTQLDGEDITAERLLNTLLKETCDD